MPTKDRRPAATDPLVHAVDRIGDRWSLLVVDTLLAGPQRFGELLDRIDGLAPNVLSKRLKQLEADALVLAEPYSRRPLRHTYRLTAAGDELAGVLRLLTQWATSHQVGSASGRAATDELAHQTCGTQIEARWYCPTCGEIVDDDQANGLHWL